MATLLQRSRGARWTVSGLGILSGLVLWQLLTMLDVASITLAPPLEVYNNAMQYRGLILDNTWPTLEVAIFGFVSALVLAIVTAIVLTASETIRETLLPLVVAGNSVPRVSLAPVIIFYVGGFQAKYMIAAWIAFFPMLVSTMEGLAQLDEDLENLLGTFEASLLQEFRYVRFPNAIPFMFDGMRIMAPLAMIGAIVGEFVASDTGLGWLALYGLRSYDFPIVFSAVIVGGLFSFAWFFTLYLLQSRFVYWQDTQLISE